MHNKGDQPIFVVSFEDGSRFVLPADWEDVFVSYFGSDTSGYADIAGRLRFVVGKYLEHRAWPSKFDGIAIEDEEAAGDSKYDSPGFYGESWIEWGEEGHAWGDQVIHTPTWAQVAEALLYQHMRSGILQKALDEHAKREGGKAPRVVTPEQLLVELEQRKEQ